MIGDRIPRMLSVAVVLVLAILAQGCGGDSDPVSPEPLWVAPAEIDGFWATAMLGPEITGGGPKDVARKFYSLSLDGDQVSGEYTEVLRDGTVSRLPFTGTYDPDTGELVITHDSPTYGEADWHFRFESGTEMWQVSPDDPDTGLILFLKA